MAKRSKEDLQFAMDQLRKDKIILSIESVVVFIAAIAFHQMMMLLSLNLAGLFVTMYLLSILFFIRMAVKNIKRKLHMRELERKVYGTEIKNL